MLQRRSLAACERGRVTNDMISCTKRRKMAARILAVRFSLCPHISAKKPISSFGGTLQDVFQTYHLPLDPDNDVQTAHNSSFGEISLDLSVHQLDVVGINTMEFRCQAKVEETEAAMCKGNEAGEVSNAFSLLMGSGMTRAFVSKKLPTYPILKRRKI